MRTRLAILFFLLGITIGFLFGGLVMRMSHETPINVLRDTVEVSKITFRVDTITEVKPLFAYRRTVDTVTIPCTDVNVELPIEQVEYEDSTYNLWISGYRPSLDSIKVFSKTVQVERLRTIRETQIVSDAKKKIYLGVGINRYDKCYTPNVNVYYSKKDFLIGATAGLINSKPIYGINVNYKIK